MVEIVSVLVGFAVIPLLAVVALSYYGLFAHGKLSVSESSHYVNTRDVETHRSESVRDVELKNTEASVADERPIPEFGDEDGDGK
jgi:hypothetical protein